MARIVVSDSSVLMDVAKVDLVEATLALPYEFVIPDVMLAEELLDLGTYTPTALLALGFREACLDGAGVAQALRYAAQYRTGLSRNDCFAMTFAETHSCILLTSDRELRSVSLRKGIEVHGLLWLIDLMIEHRTIESCVLVEALETLDQKPRVRLPQDALRHRIEQLRRSTR
jgi:predicted nucleic acid-binding protein